MNYFHTWTKCQKLSANQIFSTTDPMKILGLPEEGTDPGISLNLIIFSHIKGILEMARNRVLG